MQQGNRLAIVAVAAAVWFAVPGVATAAEADVLRETQDRAQIEQLMWRYGRAIDTFNADAYVAVFTPDGAFGATKGRDALRKMVVDLKTRRAEGEAKGEPQPAMHHIEGNRYIEFVDRDHARVHYYWLTVFGDATPASPPRVAAAGNGVDDLVRVDGKWLIRYRNVLGDE